MSASEQLMVQAAPQDVAPEEIWQPVAATAHVGTRQLSDSYLTILPDDAQGSPRGARRTSWRR